MTNTVLFVVYLASLAFVVSGTICIVMATDRIEVDHDRKEVIPRWPLMLGGAGMLAVGLVIFVEMRLV